jgi:5-methylcytosine-specific restriction endonuclease McrA
MNGDVDAFGGGNTNLEQSHLRLGDGRRGCGLPRNGPSVSSYTHLLPASPRPRLLSPLSLEDDRCALISTFSYSPMPTSTSGHSVVGLPEQRCQSLHRCAPRRVRRAEQPRPLQQVGARRVPARVQRGVGDTRRLRAHRRAIPAVLRTALIARDRTCVVPSCSSTFHLEIDHIQEYSKGGATTLANLCRLCRLCGIPHNRHYAYCRIMRTELSAGAHPPSSQASRLLSRSA